MNSDLFNLYIDAAKLLISAMNFGSELIRVDGELGIVDIHYRYGLSEFKTDDGISDNTDSIKDEQFKLLTKRMMLTIKLNTAIEDSCLKILECMEDNETVMDLEILPYIEKQLKDTIDFIGKDYIKEYIHLSRVKEKIKALRFSETKTDVGSCSGRFDLYLDELLKYCD